MNKQSYIKTLVLALGLLSISGLAQAEFVRGMDQQQVAIEIIAQINAGVSLDNIAKGANEAGLSPVQVTEALIKAGQNPVAVVKAIISANLAAAASVTAAAVAAVPSQATEITNAAIAVAPAQSKAIIVAVLIVPGINPADVLSASASGRSSESRKGPERGRNERYKFDFGHSDVHHHLPSETPHPGGGGSASPS